MKSNNRFVFCGLMNFVFCLPLFAQSSYPVIGEMCPDFQLSGVQQYHSTQVSLAMLAEKPFVIDFFSKGCSACFKSFSKVNNLTQKYNGQLEFMLVGRKDKQISKLYERFRADLNLTFPVAYDSLIFKNWGIETFPHLVWVGKDGIVKAITSSDEFTDTNIKNFIEEKPLMTAHKLNENEMQESKLLYDKKGPLLLAGNGGDDTSFMYRSVLSRWQPQADFFRHPEFISYHLKGSVQALGVPLLTLFQIAYGDTVLSRMPRNRFEKNTLNAYGDWWIRPVIETSDSGQFSYNRKTSENFYTYSLNVPAEKASAVSLKRMMQQDLENYFNLSAKVEVRKMPCWKLVASAQAAGILKTKAETTSLEYKDQYLGLRLRNQPLSVVLFELWANNQQEPPFIDATGIVGNVDLDLDVIFSDLEAVKKVLKENGLELVKSQKEMKVIVISALSEEIR